MQKDRNNKELWEIRKRILRDPEIQEMTKSCDLAYKIQQIIIEARIKNRISQSELAEMLGTHQSVISRFEAGGSNPTVNFIEGLLDVLGVKIIITADF